MKLEIAWIPRPIKTLNHADTAEDDETLSSIERRFKLARASKEQNLSVISDWRKSLRNRFVK